MILTMLWSYANALLKITNGIKKDLNQNNSIMNIWFYIIFGVCAFMVGVSTVSVHDFRGSSKSVYDFITGCNTMALLATVVLCITLFWKVSWWIPLVMLAAFWMIASLGAPLGEKKNFFLTYFCIVLYTIGFFALFCMRFY